MTPGYGAAVAIVGGGCWVVAGVAGGADLPCWRKGRGLTRD